MSQRPQESLRQLSEIFPDFHAWWEEAENSPPPEDALVDGVHFEWTHHAVLTNFMDYFLANHQAFSEKQLRSFGAWIDDALSTQGDIANAVDTCFLEHVRQAKINRVLAPYLSRKAKGARHA